MTYEDTPGWHFEVDEVSANVYVVTAKGPSGETMEKKGVCPEEMLEELRKEVKAAPPADESSK